MSRKALDLETWVARASRTVVPCVPLDRHLDHWLPDLRVRLRDDPFAAWAACHESYLRAIAVLGRRAQSVMTVLVLPLKVSARLDVIGPAPGRAWLSRAIEPPSIQLQHRDQGRFFARAEEFRRPFPLTGPLSPSAPGVRATYRCGRYNVALEHDWKEYVRTIFLEHYPEKLLGGAPSPARVGR